MVNAPLKYRHLTKEELATVRKWFDRKERFFPVEWIENAIGCAVERNGTLLAAGFFICTGLSFALCEFLETNPDESMFCQARAFRKLIRGMINSAKESGLKGLMGFVPEGHESIGRLYRRLGSKETKLLGFYKEV